MARKQRTIDEAIADLIFNVIGIAICTFIIGLLIGHYYWR